MADKAPLKLASGEIQQMQTGDTISTVIAPGNGTPNSTATSTALAIVLGYAYLT